MSKRQKIDGGVCKTCKRPWKDPSDGLELALTTFINEINELHPGSQYRRGRYTENYVAIARHKYNIYCFVARTDHANVSVGVVERGDVLRAATSTRPAKYARGNLFDEYGGLRGADGNHPIGPYGPHYLK